MVAATVGSLMFGVTAPPTPAQPPATCVNSECTIVFDYTGFPQEWQAPMSVASATISVLGAQGGTTPNGVPGGAGAHIVATVPVASHRIYSILVGGAAPGGASPEGGSFGGGQGSDDGADGSAGGGGASGVDDPFSGPLLVAGGGGGGGGHGYGSASGTGGAGGASAASGATGERATGLENGDGGDGGQAASPTSGGGGGGGGHGATDGTTGGPGTSGVGGDGALRVDTGGSEGTGSGGGGGGGYFGGGGGGSGGTAVNVALQNLGGGGGGGGGGSNFVGNAARSVTVTDGVRTSNGEVVITYTVDNSTTTTLQSTPNPSTAGEAIDFSATVEPTVPPSSGTDWWVGTVTFTDNGTTLGTTALGGDRGDTATLSVRTLAVGSHSITATYNGDANHSASASSTLVQQVLPLGQVIAFTTPAPSAAVVDGPGYTPAASGGQSGNPVTFTIDSTSSDVCTLSASAVSFTAPGTCTIDADQPGNSNYTSAPQAQQAFAVGQADQVIAFTTPAPSAAVVDGPGYTPAASGGQSGNPVTFTIDSTSSDVCTLSASAVSFTAPGTCTIDADQPGNNNYTSAPQAQQAFAVGQADQVIAFTTPAPSAAVVDGPGYTPAASGGQSGNPVTFTIDSTSSDVCTLSASAVSFTAPGTCTIDADQPGNNNYATAPQAQQNIPVAPGAQAITITSPIPVHPAVGHSLAITAIGGKSGNPVVFTLTNASSAGACTVTGTGLVSFTGLGSCVVLAQQSGDSDYGTVTATVLIDVDTIPPAIVNTRLPGGKVGLRYTSVITDTGTPTPTQTITAGHLPPGLALRGDHVLAGTPTTAGTYTFSVAAINRGGPTTGRFALTIGPITPTTPTPTPPTTSRTTPSSTALLAVTGAPIAQLVALALLLIATGGALARRRRPRR